MKANKLSVFEIVWYSICSAVILWGVTYIVLGLVASYAPVSPHDNLLMKASNDLAKSFGMGFFGWGIAILLIGVGAATVVLLAYANKVGKSADKAARRAARLAKFNEENN